MISNDALQARINEQLAKALEKLDCACPRLKSAMQYAVLGGGKRTRAILSYLVGESLGLAVENIDPIAIAIEYLHAYTLIHDDLPAMDDDDFRRHQPSCHIKFDEATAILAGDALQTLSFSALLTADATPETITKMIHHFTEAVGASGLCAGQSLDMQHTADNINIEQLKHSHRLKTGVLFGIACVLPGVMAKRDNQSLLHLQAAGESIGLLFQINDDMIDQSDDLHTLGKTPGKDKEANKASFANCLDKDSLTKAKQQARTDCQEKLKAAKLDQIITTVPSASRKRRNGFLPI